MNAIDFIKQHGIEKAREVVSKHAECYMPEVFKYWSEQLQDYVLAPKYASFLVSALKRLVDSVDLVNQLDSWGRTDVGIKKAKEVIGNNTLQASYYQPSSGFYYRYGHNSLYIVRDGEWKEIYGGMDSNTLIHTDRLKQAIADYEVIYGGEHV